MFVAQRLLLAHVEHELLLEFVERLWYGFVGPQVERLRVFAEHVEDELPFGFVVVSFDFGRL